MNRYEFDKIIQRENTLKSSHNFADLMNAININKSKKFNSTYNTGNDYGITLSKYIEKLNKEESKPVETPNNGGVASDAAKKADTSNRTKNGGSQTTTSQQKSQRGGV